MEQHYFLFKRKSGITGPAIRTFIEPLEIISYEDNVVTFKINKDTQEIVSTYSNRDMIFTSK